MRRVFKTAGALALSVLAVFTIIAGWSFGEAWQKHHYNQPPGKFFIVNGKSLHIECSGQGSPAVVLESAASAPWSEWRLVQPQLSDVTRVCSYDRSGHGWSPPSSDARDAEAVVRDLHGLLDSAGVLRPFVLVGHSAGGPYVREYAHEYPNEIAGVALIESSSPQQMDELPGFRASYEEDERDARGLALWKDRARVWSGWDRLVGNCSVSSSKTIQGKWVAQYAAMACRPGYVDTDEIELPYFEASSKESAQLKSFGSIPLLVVSRDVTFGVDDESPRGRAQQPVWEREQEEEKTLSQRSWRVIAQNSGHMVPIEHPDVIVREVTRLVSYVRGGVAPPFGSTTLAQ
jgi:pimeloyl-ACP methyl ester carboxylesterase